MGRPASAGPRIARLPTVATAPGLRARRAGDRYPTLTLRARYLRLIPEDDSNNSLLDHRTDG
jgi:hypothetical protein